MLSVGHPTEKNDSCAYSAVRSQDLACAHRNSWTRGQWRGSHCLNIYSHSELECTAPPPHPSLLPTGHSSLPHSTFRLEQDSHPIRRTCREMSANLVCSAIDSTHLVPTCCRTIARTCFVLISHLSFAISIKCCRLTIAAVRSVSWSRMYAPVFPWSSTSLLRRSSRHLRMTFCASKRNIF